MDSPQIFLSYSWKNSKEADEIDQFFSGIGVVLIRDIRDLENGKSIKEFSQSISNRDYLIMLISRDYLHSTNCMDEMVELLKTNQLEKRLLPTFISSWYSVFSTEALEEYFNFWKLELQKCNERLSVHVNEKFLDDKRKIENIYNNLGIFFKIIVDLKIQAFDELKKTSFLNFIERINYFSISSIEEIVEIQDLTDEEEKEIRIDQFLERFPNNHYGWFQRGVIADRNAQFKRAEASWKKALTIFPQDALASYNLARLYHDYFKNYDLAKSYYLESISINEKYASAHYNYAVLLDTLSESGDAIKHFELALELNPEHPYANYNLGVLIQKEDPIKAIKLYQRALEVQPEFAEAHVNLGVLIEKQLYAYDKARKHFTEAARINPNLHQAHSNLGRILKTHFKEGELGDFHLNKAKEIQFRSLDNI